MKNHKSVFTSEGVIRHKFLLIICCQVALMLCWGPKILAAETLGVPELYKTIEGAKTYIVEHQNRNGGWALLPESQSEVDATALAIWALVDSGWGTGSTVIRMGVAYLRHAQRENGSWNNNTGHTAFALIALSKAQTDPASRFKGLQWISKAQHPSGGWPPQERGTTNILYTAIVMAALKTLRFDVNFEPASKGADWLAERISGDGGWVLQRGRPDDVFLTAWVLQGLSTVYNIDAQIAWVKQMQNKDGGFGRHKGTASDAEVTAAAIMALAAGNDLFNTRRVAINYLTRVRQPNGSFVSNTPWELTEPASNLQSTCFVLIAIHAKTDDEISME